MGSLVVVSGPSGAGKTTIAAEAVARRPRTVLSLSATTRERRDGEAHGVNYLFLSDEEFTAMEARGEFIETALVHGNRYGTPKAPIEAALGAGDTVVLEIDVQGAATIKAARPDAVLVFVRPPSMAVLEERLRGRGTDAPEVIARRLHNAEVELAEAGRFDHQIVNEDLQEAISQLIRILDGSQSPERADRPTSRGPGNPGGSA